MADRYNYSREHLPEQPRPANDWLVVYDPKPIPPLVRVAAIAGLSVVAWTLVLVFAISLAVILHH